MARLPRSISGAGLFTTLSALDSEVPARRAAMKIPSLILKQMYTFGSLRNTEQGVEFSIKNRLADATVSGLREVRIDGTALPLSGVTLDFGNGHRRLATDITSQSPLDFPLRRAVIVSAPHPPLAKGDHDILISFDSSFGELTVKVHDAIAEEAHARIRVPLDKDDNYSAKIVAERQRFIERYAGVKLQHL